MSTTSSPEFSWYFDRARHRYVIMRGKWVYQVVVPHWREPANTRTYVMRSVAILNGESDAC